MHVFRFSDPEGVIHHGLVSGPGQAQVLAGDPYAGFRDSGRAVTVSRLLAPVSPTNIFCIGLNYRAHAAESGMPIPRVPVVFMKPTSAVCGPEDDIVLPACRHHDEVDYECELVAVIGRVARNVPVHEALGHVAGYTCGNDVSARHWQLQRGGGQWCRGKGFDTFCPLGPSLVTPDEIPDPQQLSICTRLNGDLMQAHSTADMIFTVAQLISFLSQDTTLLPGTVIMTGTPGGVGFARQPPVFLRTGDLLEVEIGGIGVLRNRVRAA
jgi:2-keto-4-pentenoate hydratase/2-oxohepta-3-ene-1,7-dioic acid hydratase in catechol pathway